MANWEINLQREGEIVIRECMGLNPVQRRPLGYSTPNIARPPTFSLGSHLGPQRLVFPSGAPPSNPTVGEGPEPVRANARSPLRSKIEPILGTSTGKAHASAPQGAGGSDVLVCGRHPFVKRISSPCFLLVDLFHPIAHQTGDQNQFSQVPSHSFPAFFSSQSTEERCIDLKHFSRSTFRFPLLLLLQLAWLSKLWPFCWPWSSELTQH
jgi:hypothetical protein